MKKLVVNALAAAMLLAASVSQAAMTLDFGALPDSTIQFNGTSSSFQINNNLAGGQWWVTSGGTGAALAVPGWFTGGPWSYGAITVSGSDEWALVTGPLGTLTMTPAVAQGGGVLTGTVDWVKVSTSSYIGGVNASATVNITGLTYGGTNPDLLALVSGGSGSVNMSFQFATSGLTLTGLTTGTGPYTTSYSGSLSAVPEPTTILAGALLLLPFGASTIRALRRK